MASSLDRLMEGNRKFVAGKNTELMAKLAKGQQPYAAVLTCADSRVSPEIIFGGKGLGEIFVVRNAGNIADPIALGSIEYAVEHLHAPLVLVLGHESCGAVAATCAGGHAPSHIAAVVKAIAPSAQKAGNNVPKAVEENVRTQVEAVKKSPIVSHLMHEGKVEVRGAVYSLATGEVKLI
ncbi:Carbonic anhydrase [Candidatus Gugararchaeum adminiculabundum]|nr:Carbonic anhydrase [Candidatus Gugararchaeum adminiculabundum]